MNTKPALLTDYSDSRCTLEMRSLIKNNAQSCTDHSKPAALVEKPQIVTDSGPDDPITRRRVSKTSAGADGVSQRVGERRRRIKVGIGRVAH